MGAVPQQQLQPKAGKTGESQCKYRQFAASAEFRRCRDADTLDVRLTRPARPCRTTEPVSNKQLESDGLSILTALWGRIVMIREESRFSGRRGTGVITSAPNVMMRSDRCRQIEGKPRRVGVSEPTMSKSPCLGFLTCGW